MTGFRILLFLIVLLGCQKDRDQPDVSDAIFQISTLGALNEGDFDGRISFGQLSDQGDFGLGTFEAVDGEMVMLEGVFYQIRDDGVVSMVGNEQESPFAVLKHFVADEELPLGQIAGFSNLQQVIDDHLVELDGFYAMRIDATFDSLLIRSVSKQTPPYPTLSQVVAGQTTFLYTDIAGTLVGFRLPDFIADINAAGYHFHFISDNRSIGGHMLNCTIRNGLLEIDEANDLIIRLN